MNLVNQLVEDARAAGGPRPLSLSPRRILAWHLAIIALLVACHLGVALLLARTGRGETLWRMVHLSREANLPSFFSACALLAAALGAWLLARLDGGRNATPWRLAGLILLFLALDEAAMLHEQLKWLGPREAGRMSLFWLMPYGAMVVAVVWILLPFWLRLPPPARAGLALSALLYVGGAMGMEVVESRFYAGAAGGRFHWPMILSVTVEELMEMLAVAVLIWTMLRHAARLRQPVLTVSVSA
jgi:hypothetical protein